MILRILFIAVFVFFCPLQAAIISIPQDFPTIQDGIDASLNGDTIMISPGTYNESLLIDKSLCLKSLAGPESTLLHPASATNGIIRVTSGSTKFILSGFTISGAQNANYAVSIDGSTFLVENNYITNNKQSPALILNGPSGRVLGNRVYENSGGGCSGIWVREGDGVEIAYNVVYENRDSDCSGIRLDGGSGPSLVHHNVVYANQSDTREFAAAMNVNGVWNVYNNTIAANESAQTSAALWIGNSTIDTRNNLVVSNINCSGIRSAGRPEFNDSWNNSEVNFESALGDGNIQLDPEFLDAPASNFKLAATSPCINSGDPNEIYNDIDGSRNDIGALPFLASGYPFAAMIHFGADAPNNAVPTLTPTIYWTFVDSAALTQTAYEIELGTDFDWSAAELWQPGVIFSDLNFAAYSGSPLANQRRYYLRIRLYNGTNWGEWAQTNFTIRTSATIRVPQDFADLQSAVDAARVHDTVLVSPGTYVGQISIARPITLISTAGPELTILEPLNNSEQLLISSYAGLDSLILQGFTFRGARNTDYAVIISSSPYRIENNRFTDNLDCVPLRISSTRGGIIRINEFFLNRGTTAGAFRVETGPNSIIERNSVHDNTSNSCAGVRLDTGIGCVFRFNLIYKNSGTISNAACALNVNGSWLIRNNTVAGNSNLNAAAAVWVGGGSIDVRNNVIAFNHGCYGLRGAQAYYNDCFGNAYGEFQDCNFGPGNFTLDPQFADTAQNLFNIGPDSPCINSGDPNPIYNDPDGSRSDIGALMALPAPFVSNLTLIGEPDINHVITNVPSFQWHFDGSFGFAQTSVEIAVGTDNNWLYAEMWNPAPIATADSLIVYNGAPLLDGHTYWMRLRTANNLGWSAWTSLTLHLNQKPSVPQQRSPALNSNTASAFPTLVIRNSTDSESDSIMYTFEIALDSSMTSVQQYNARQSLDSLTALKLTQALLEDVKYFWRVRASDYLETSAWSEVWPFSIDTVNTAPTEFELLLPGNTSVPLATKLLTFDWTKSTDADPLDQVSYTFYLATDSNFTFVEIKPAILADSLQLVEPLEWAARYWWKVKAQDLNGAETWSTEVFRFRTMTIGDNDANGVISITDIVYVINFIFAGGPLPIPPQAGDVNCDQKFSITDAVYLVNYIFADGPLPCEP